jgi:replicative DNA helicase
VFDSLQKTIQNINASYVMARATSFVRHQSMKRAMAEAIRKLEVDSEEGLDEAEAILSNAMKRTADVFDPGVNFMLDREASLSFLDDPEESIPTGIPALDSRNLGPIKGRFHLFVGPAKSGKSWWLINAAKHAHMANKRVLYVSLELGEPEVCQRLSQALFSMSKRELGLLKYRRFLKTDESKDWGTEFNTVNVRTKHNFQQDGIREVLSGKMRIHGEGERIVIKSFPMGTLSTGGLDAYLDLLEHREKFVPDLICIDYADIMKVPGKKDRWEGLLEVYQNIHRIGKERHVAMASASQTKQSGSTAKRVDMHHVGGAWDKNAIADMILTYAQTDEEKRDGMARLFQAAARTEEDRFEILLSQNYGIGQFALSSIRLGSGYARGGDEDED